MRPIIILCTLLLTQNLLYGQKKAELDKGFGTLFINQKLRNISSCLQPITDAQLWQPNENPLIVTSLHTVDLARFSQKSFFSIPVERIEVFMQHSLNRKGQAAGEDIYRFIVYMPAPPEAVYEKLILDLMERYGPVFTTSIHDDGSQSPNWFTETTLLTVSGENVYCTYKGRKYITANFYQAYGG
ncbi:MAG: hypothetical protein IBJ09_11910 [Bacteroidia bacterium]|nr:hypothetical protein [Bacteroidia bacterium]